MTSEREITRLAMMCFKRMAEPDAYLQDVSTYLGDQKIWGVFTARNGFKTPLARVSAQVVNEFSRRDWIIHAGPSRARLSEAGRAWFKRQTADTDPFGAQHHDRVQACVGEASGVPVCATVNQKESPLTWLRARRDADGNALLSNEQFRAGERLRRDFELAQMRPHVTANWDFGIAGKRRSRAPAMSADMSDTALAAKQRFFRALDDVGPELAGILVGVCCYLNGLAGAEENLGWPRRSGKVVLLIALNALARHYGLLKVQQHSKSRIGRWGAEDYRPSI